MYNMAYLSKRYINVVLYINYIVLAIDLLLGWIAIDPFMGWARGLGWAQDLGVGWPHMMLQKIYAPNHITNVSHFVHQSTCWTIRQEAKLWGGSGVVGWHARCGASLFLFFVMESASNPIRPPLPHQVIECFFPEDFMQLGRGALPCFRYELKHNLSFVYFCLSESE